MRENRRKKEENVMHEKEESKGQIKNIKMSGSIVNKREERKKRDRK